MVPRRLRPGEGRRLLEAVCADDVASPKPDPAMYLAACAALGVDPRECVAFEDSRTGVRAAHAAGLRCVGVPTLPHVVLDADVVLPSLSDPRLGAWVRRW